MAKACALLESFITLQIKAVLRDITWIFWIRFPSCDCDIQGSGILLEWRNKDGYGVVIEISFRQDEEPDARVKGITSWTVTRVPYQSGGSLGNKVFLFTAASCAGLGRHWGQRNCCLPLCCLSHLGWGILKFFIGQENPSSCHVRCEEKFIFR